MLIGHQERTFIMIHLYKILGNESKQKKVRRMNDDSRRLEEIAQKLKITKGTV